MAFIEVLIQETTENFGLRAKGIAVISALLARMNNPASGGIEGFLHCFHQAGLTEKVNTWLQNDVAQQLTASQLKAALGHATLQQMADKTELPLAQTTEVIAHLIPLIVGHLAVQNSLFSTQPNQIRRALWSHHSPLPRPVAVNNPREAPVRPFR